jgi:hypothetical protein
MTRRMVCVETVGDLAAHEEAIERQVAASVMESHGPGVPFGVESVSLGTTPALGDLVRYSSILLVQVHA